jgi:hypothetical protein
MKEYIKIYNFTTKKNPVYSTVLNNIIKIKYIYTKLLQIRYLCSQCKLYIYNNHKFNSTCADTFLIEKILYKKKHVYSILINNNVIIKYNVFTENYFTNKVFVFTK